MTYYRDRHSGKRQNRKYFFSAGVLVLLMLIGLAAWYLRLGNKPKAVNETTTNTNSVAVTGSLSGKYLFSGTIVLARAVEKYAYGNYNQPFGGIDTLGTYDDRIGILECPVTNNQDSYDNEVNNLIFNCKPGWLPYLKKYYPILNLSSDHLNDQGPQGIADTFKNLNAAGFQTVGTYNPHSLKDDCKPILLPVHVNNGRSQTMASLPIVMCSYNYKFLFQPQKGEISSITKWSKILPVIALLNEGPEYHQQASQQTVGYAHQMIDAGADFLVGNGTHWVQNTEVYKGKLIVYSLGNFIFDQLDYNGRIALNLSVSLTIPNNNNVSSWLKYAKQCQAAGDGCLALAQNKGLKRFDASYKFDAVGSYGGDRVVTSRANTSQQADIEKIANWQQTLKQLGQ